MIDTETGALAFTPAYVTAAAVTLTVTANANVQLSLRSIVNVGGAGGPSIGGSGGGAEGAPG